MVHVASETHFDDIAYLPLVGMLSYYMNDFMTSDWKITLDSTLPLMYVQLLIQPCFKGQC
jgi:hypothetical protein